MNYPPIFETCVADGAVVALLGESGGVLRLYPAGVAPQGATKPYAVWQSLTGGPENYLGGRPDIDRHVLQIDAYAETLTAARAIAEALEEAVELVAHVTAFRGEEKDPETALYRVGFEVEWYVVRPAPGPAPVSSEPVPPASSSEPAPYVYRLDDDGTLAAAFGYGHLPTTAPAHRAFAYTTAGGVTGGLAAAASSVALTDGLIAPAAGKVGFGLSLSSMSAAEGLEVALQPFQYAAGLHTRVIALVKYESAAFSYDLRSGTFGGGTVSDFTGAIVPAGAALGVLLDFGAGTIAYYVGGALIGQASEPLLAEGWFPTLYVKDSAAIGAGHSVAGAIVLDAVDLGGYGFPAGTTDYLGNAI